MKITKEVRYMKKTNVFPLLVSLFVLVSCNTPKGGNKGGTNKEITKEVYEDYINPKKLLLERNLSITITSDYTSSSKTGRSIRTVNLNQGKLEMSIEQTGDEESDDIPNYGVFSYDESSDTLSLDWYVKRYNESGFDRYIVQHIDETPANFSYYVGDYLGLIFDVTYDELTYESGVYVAHHMTKHASEVDIDVDRYEISFSDSFVSKIKLAGSFTETSVSYTYIQEITFSKFNSVSVTLPTI